MGGHAYIAAGGLHVADISDPTSPRVIGQIAAGGGSVAAAGDHAYLTAYKSIQVVDISNPLSPPIAGSVDTPASARNVVVAGALAYVADWFAGLQVINISNPGSPAIIGSVDTPSYTVDVAVSGSYAYLANGYSGLIVVDVSSPTSPAIIGRVDTPDFANGVAVAGSYAYIARDSSLLVIDISDPTTPAITGEVKTPGIPWRVAVDGSHAYVADNKGLHVIDISTPTSPAVVASIFTTRSVTGVTVRGSYAYIAGSPDLQVVDISTPTSPRIVGSANAPGAARGVAVLGSYAYIAGSSAGLQVIDISIPTAPEIVGGVNTPDLAIGVTVAGDYAYIAGDVSGLQVLHTQCEIMTPVSLDNLEATPADEGIRIRWQVHEGSFAGFVIMRGIGSSPSDAAYQALNPDRRVPGEGPWAYHDRNVVPGETYAYKIVGFLRNGGRETVGPVFAIAITSPTPFALLPARPNPARGKATLRFDLPHASDVRLVIYDLAGRQVRRLHDGPASAGRHVVPWDGRNDHGHPVASEIYFVRLTWPTGAATTRVTLLR